MVGKAVSIELFFDRALNFRRGMAGRSDPAGIRNADSAIGTDLLVRDARPGPPAFNRVLQQLLQAS